MEQKATPYTYSDWMLLFVAAQAVIDLYTPNATFGATVGLAMICAAFRFLHYIAERLALFTVKWRGAVARTIVMTFVLCAGIWFIPDILQYIVHHSGK
ncbi:hypothetical protein Rvan_1425 [Rhodomicrobium vannielii ATCC 17100]|uniref:Uncharacterized protein n=1 Tax=Rhodomicrobium vannielii (strain ATCC 17100 / DSM 162 / LMG 4299 / NCIMB 10020 / ATH 3.1.1) TaxID=648757 RepID=E3I6N5_RHOVT|nr:hypothetical protein [Rhodomicrobium vannielii]ADP70682.1 hypothetical protein Rvan_1425 [Rhodomicrobium vannielii ATCC 17100]